jgi:phosphatidylserine decarboxylase
MTKVYNRQTKNIEEVKHFGGNKLNKIYKYNLLTRILTSKTISRIYGWTNSTRLSKKKISKFIKENNIDMNLYKKEKYYSFNDFFIRKKKNISFDNGFISPCDGKLLVYKIKDNLSVRIKNQNYYLSELIEEVDSFKKGYVFVYRLSLDNYHRFHYIDDGKRIKRIKHNGRLHTVSSSSAKYKIYIENEREYSVLETKHYGKIIYMEVGALLVGKIINHNLDTFKRGEEKGYFLPGGSTIIIIANNIKVDNDILEQSKKNIETIVHVGEKVGR